MAKLFAFKRRAVECGTFNNRLELHGESKIKAIDLPMRHQVTVKELDMLVPSVGDMLFSQFIYGTERKPKLQCFVLSPLKVARKPERIVMKFFDNAVDNRMSMQFEEVTVKDPILELDDDGRPVVSYKAQIHPGEFLQRICDNVEGKTVDFECKAAEPELFDEENDNEAPDPQADIEDGQPPNESADEAEEDDEEEAAERARAIAAKTANKKGRTPRKRK